MNKKILVPLDGSRPSESILSNIKALAVNGKVLVILLKVLEPPLMLGRDEVIDIGVYQEQRRVIKLEEERYLFDVGEQLRSDHIDFKVIVESGFVLETILAVAKQEDVDLVAMASHRMSEWSYFLPESTTIKVMLRTDRPMIVQHSQKNAAF